MYTENKKRLYEKMSLQLRQMVPEKCPEILMYSEANENSNIFYCKLTNNKKPIYYLDIPKIFNIDQVEFENKLNNLNKYSQQLWNEFKNNNEKPWTIFTLKVISDGNYEIEYDYSGATDKELYKKRIIWIYENLGIYEEKDKKLIEEYIKKNK